MIPREVLIELAKLQMEARTLQDQFLTELETIAKDLEAKYAPRLGAIHEAQELYKQKIHEHESLSQELYWRIHDRENHQTHPDTTKLMKKAQLRESKQRRTYEIK